MVRDRDRCKRAETKTETTKKLSRDLQPCYRMIVEHLQRVRIFNLRTLGWVTGYNLFRMRERRDGCLLLHIRTDRWRVYKRMFA